MHVSVMFFASRKMIPAEGAISLVVYSVQDKMFREPVDEKDN